jgi:hyperosmotically inducible periplasmic protein
MKKTFLSAALAVLLVAGYSCKGKDKNTTTDTTTTNTTTTAPPPPPTAPVVVSGDDSLRQGVTDATKDIKGLQTRVESGVIYLSGTISRDDNMRITPTLNSLRPKSINRDNLTVQ